MPRTERVEKTRTGSSQAHGLGGGGSGKKEVSPEQGVERGLPGGESVRGRDGEKEA